MQAPPILFHFLLFESGNYLSSQRLTVSTFGVKELNFCVRNGYRWILFAIITAMVIYLCPLRHLHILVYSASAPALFPRHSPSRFCLSQKTDNYIAKLQKFLHIFLSCVLVKIIEFFVKRVRKIQVFLSFQRSSPRPISIGQLLHCCIYTSDLSTWLSSRGLTSLRCGIPYLEASFTLRCFQRLSQPHSATLLCRWRDNRCTVGAFIPVLSY